MVEAFAAWLTGHGWTGRFEVDWWDLLAERDGQRLYAEAKGRTAAPGLDMDTTFGQLIRRMPAEDDPAAIFASLSATSPSRFSQRSVCRSGYDACCGSWCSR